MKLGDLLKTTDEADALDAFLQWAEDKGLSLYPAQEEAILEIFDDHHVILDTPTGSGKSLVALALHFRELLGGRTSFYTAPIKALVAEKFRALALEFGADSVGLMTGDGSVNRDAPILCCTAEVLAKIALRHGADTDASAVVMDEFHYYGDRDRGMAWQLPLLVLPHTQFLLMSATLGNTSKIESDLAEKTKREVTVVSSTTRPVPLRFSYRSTPMDASIRDLVGQDRSPIYAVHFTQRAAAERASALLSSDYCTKEEKAEISRAVGKFRFDSPFGKTLRRLVLHGVGLHHAGLLPKYRMLIETLAQRGLFKVICGTDTLGVGINVPLRTVLFTQLCKFDGEQVRILSSRHFKQIAGRAGRKGYDDEGFVAAQAPEWVIENLKLEASITAGKKKRNKVKKKSAPTRGYKHWDEATFRSLVDQPPEALESRFKVDHGSVLTVLQKATEELGDGMQELHDLIDTSHSSARAKARLHTDADARLNELILAGVVTDDGEDSVPRYAVKADLQDDFSLHHSLSLYLLHALSTLDLTQPEHPLHILTHVESILEHPGVILRAQIYREKTVLINSLKADGVPYEERMEMLEEVSYPKPGGELIYELYNDYVETRPWLKEHPIRPKSIVREMVQTQLPFTTYIKELKIPHAEGVLLRYCSQVYRTMLQNVPETYRTPEVVDVLGFLRAMLARVDDSLVADWETMRNPVDDKPSAAAAFWTDPRAVRARIRAELFGLVRALSERDYEEAANRVRAGEDAWTAEQFESALGPFYEEREAVIFDGRLKQGWTTIMEQTSPQTWSFRQILVDDGTLDEDEVDQWTLDGVVDLTGGTPSGPLIHITGINN